MNGLFRPEWSTLKKLMFLQSANGGSYATATGNPVSFTAKAAPLKQLQIAFSPVQDLHGYDAPWPAGGGKNIYPNSSISGSADGITVTHNVYDESYTVSGLSSAYRGFLASSGFTLKAGTYTLSRTASSGTASGANLRMELRSMDGLTTYASTNNAGTFTFAEDTEVKARIVVGAGNVDFGTGITYRFQLERGSSPSTWVPYSNICPISGWDGVTVNRTGVNWYPVSIGADYWTNFNNGSSSNNNGELIVSMAARMYSGVYSQPDAQIRKLSKYSVTASYSVNIKASVATEIFIGYAQKGNRKVQLTTEYQRFTFENFAFGTDNSFNIYNGTANAATVYLKDFQFELGSTATAYEPYNGNTYAVDWTTEAGTVYGGTLDVVNGKMTVDRVSGSKQLSQMSQISIGNVATRYFIQNFFGNGINVYGEASGNGKTICNLMDTYVYNTSDNIHYFVTNGGGINVFVPNGTPNDIEIQIIATLATPFELTLTPEQISTLHGTNNVWSDAGDVTVEYRSN